MTSFPQTSAPFPSSPADAPVASVRDSSQLVATLPYLLGFHPTESLVVLGLVPSSTGRLCVGPCARIDLPPVGTPAAILWDAVHGRMARHSRHLVVVGYVPGSGDRDDPASAWGCKLLDEILVLAGRADVEVVDAVVVGATGWWSLLAPDSACRPSRLQPLPDPSQVEAVADLVLAGSAPFADRDAALARVRAAPEDDRCRDVRDALAGGGRSPRAAAGEQSGWAHVVPGLDAWARLLGWAQASEHAPAMASQDEWSAQDLAAAVTVIQDKAVRDAVLAWCAPGMIPAALLPHELRDRCLRALGRPVRWGSADRERREVLQERLLLVARVVPPEHAAGVLTIAGVVAWSLGDHMIAAAALRRALAVEPGHTMARLVLPAVERLAVYSEVIGHGRDDRDARGGQAGRAAHDVQHRHDAQRPHDAQHRHDADHRGAHGAGPMG